MRRVFLCALFQVTHEKLCFSMDFHIVSFREDSSLFLKCSAGNPSSYWKKYYGRRLKKKVPVSMLIPG